jgi:hypothetical protein
LKEAGMDHEEIHGRITQMFGKQAASNLVGSIVVSPVTAKQEMPITTKQGIRVEQLRLEIDEEVMK